MVQRSTQYPRTFRNTELLEVFDRIIDGDSLSIVGIGTVGKTQLVEHFTGRRDVQDYYIKQCGIDNFGGEQVLFVRFDRNAMIDPATASLEDSLPAAWPAFELLFRRLVEAVREREKAGDELAAGLRTLYLELSDRRVLGPQRAFQLLEEAMGRVFTSRRPPVSRVAIVFDEFEPLPGLMPDSFFRNLRALRDRFRYQLVYFTLSRREITELVPEDRYSELEPFVELFRMPLYLGPYTEPEDIRHVLDYLVRRKKDAGWRWPPNGAEVLQQVSGGHAGLMRTCFEHLDLFADLAANNNDQRRFNDLINAFLSQDAVNRECETILQSFSTQEQSLLTAIARNGSVVTGMGDMVTLERLRRKHVLAEARRNAYRVTPPLLHAYLSR